MRRAGNGTVGSNPTLSAIVDAPRSGAAAMKWFCPAPFQEGALASALGGKRPFVLSPLKFDYFSYSTSEDVHLEWLGYYEHAVVEAAFSDNGILCISRNE